MKVEQDNLPRYSAVIPLASLFNRAIYLLVIIIVYHNKFKINFSVFIVKI